MRTQKLFLIQQKPSKDPLERDYVILGTTGTFGFALLCSSKLTCSLLCLGNVYTVKLNKQPSCNCADNKDGQRNHCKHIVCPSFALCCMCVHVSLSICIIAHFRLLVLFSRAHASHRKHGTHAQARSFTITHLCFLLQLFVFLKVLKLPEDDKRIFQKALLSSEVRDLLKMAKQAKLDQSLLVSDWTQERERTRGA